MNRRRFLQSIAAVFSLPAMPSLSIGSTATASTAVSAVPTQARFWAIYMSGLHGECPPHALQSILNIPAVDAKKYVTQLVTEGVIKPNPLLQRSVSKLVKTDDDSLFAKVKKRLEMKSEAQEGEPEPVESAEEVERQKAEDEAIEKALEDTPDMGLSAVVEDEEIETTLLNEKLQELDETEPQNCDICSDSKEASLNC